MPRVVTFAPCRRVIIDEREKSPSLIGLFDHVNLQLPADEIVPSEAVAALEWHVFIWWLSTPDEREKVFEQKLTLISPDGQEFLSEVTELRFVEAKHRTVAIYPGFPVHLPGAYSLKLSVRELEQDWLDVAEYSIELRYIYPPEEQTTT